MRRISFQHRKVYLRRGKTFLDKHMYNSGRHVVNEEKLIDVLQKYGFEILDPLALGQDETRKILGETEHLITPIGASLINCIYLAAGAQVSTFSPWYKGANFDYYRQITSALNLRFSVVLGSLVDKKTDDPAHSRFRISERNLISHLEQAGYRPK
jgi:capsular polysaccharide biosynthesis protein